MCAELGLLPAQYYDLTVGEILRHYRAYNLRETKAWERTRFIAWYGALPYDSKGRLREPYDVLKLSTDPSDEERALIRERQVQELREAAAAQINYLKTMGYSV